MATNDDDKVRREVGLPPLVFTFTLDQVAAMLSLDLALLRRSYLYYAQRSVGRHTPNEMYAFNVAPADMPAEWRVSQREFVRFCKYKGMRTYDVTSNWKSE